MIQNQIPVALWERARSFVAPALLIGLMALALSLAVRGGLLAAELASVNGEVAAQAKLEARHASSTLTHGGAPLLAATPSQAPAAATVTLARAMTDAGMGAPIIRLDDRVAFGPALELLNFEVQAEADAASIVAFSQWIDHRRQAVVLTDLVATPVPGRQPASLQMHLSVLVRTATR